MRIFGMWWNGFLISTEFRPVSSAVVLAVVIGLHAVALAAALLLHIELHIRLLLIAANLATVVLSLWRVRRAVGQTSVRRVVIDGGGRWVLQSADGNCSEAALRAGWLAGPFAGLCWVDPNGGRRHVWLSRRRNGPVGWRRLRVRLRHPAGADLS
jgi:hypothetical protein